MIYIYNINQDSFNNICETKHFITKENTKYTLTEDIHLSKNMNIDNCTFIMVNNTIFDGNNFNIYIYDNDKNNYWKGLFSIKNGTNNVSILNVNINVIGNLKCHRLSSWFIRYIDDNYMCNKSKNINIENSSCNNCNIYYDKQGCFIPINMFNNLDEISDDYNIKIKNCKILNSIIKANYSGGFTGANVCNNGGKMLLEDCISNIEINGNGCGGLIGNRNAKNKGYIHIKNCIYNGYIVNGINNGGLIGNNTGYNNTIIINNFLNIGDLVYNNFPIGCIRNDCNIQIKDIEGCYYVTRCWTNNDNVLKFIH